MIKTFPLTKASLSTTVASLWNKGQYELACLIVLATDEPPEAGKVNLTNFRQRHSLPEELIEKFLDLVIKCTKLKGATSKAVAIALHKIEIPTNLSSPKRRCQTYVLLAAIAAQAFKLRFKAISNLSYDPNDPESVGGSHVYCEIEGLKIDPTFWKPINYTPTLDTTPQFEVEAIRLLTKFNRKQVQAGSGNTVERARDRVVDPNFPTRFMMKPRNPTEEHLPTTPPPNDTRPGPESLHTKSPQSIYEELGDIGFTNMMKRTKLVQDKGSGWPDLFGPIKREKNKAGGIIRLASTETNSAKTITFQEAEKGYKFFHVISNRHPLARDGQPPKRIVFKPRVPKGYVYEDDFGEAIEDTTTRRVSLAKTIKGCLSGSLYESYNDEDWYVYGTKQSISVVDLSKVKCPIENYGEDFVWEKSQYKDLSRRDRTKLLVNCVPDMKKSGELWSLASVEMQYIGKVTGIRTQKIVPASTEINAVSDNSTMVALWAPADLMSPLKPIVKQFKNPVDVKDLHVTLVYIGDTTRDEVGLVENHVRELCDATGLLTAKVGGIGYFEPSESSDGKYPIYLSISCPGLDLLRADLWRALEKEGIKLPEDWGFSPHLTIAYATKEEKDKLTKLDLSDVLGKSWQVTSLAVCHGQARKYVKLGERGKVPIVGAK